jgi:hypothetical protein
MYVYVPALTNLLMCNSIYLCTVSLKTLIQVTFVSYATRARSVRSKFLQLGHKSSTVQMEQ